MRCIAHSRGSPRGLLPLNRQARRRDRRSFRPTGVAPGEWVAEGGFAITVVLDPLAGELALRHHLCPALEFLRPEIERP
jgi:hypothetical protein